MSGDSDIFALINTSDPKQLSSGFGKLLNDTSISSKLSSGVWVDLILAWYLAGVRMPAPLAQRFVETLAEAHLSDLNGSIYESFLPDIANAVLGIEVFERVSQNYLSTVTYKTAFRAAAFGVYKFAAALDCVTCAREACYLLHSLELHSAIHALACLAILSSKEGEAVEQHDEIQTFLTDAQSYLALIIPPLSNSELVWEVRLWQETQMAMQ